MSDQDGGDQTSVGPTLCADLLGPPKTARAQILPNQVSSPPCCAAALWTMEALSAGAGSNVPAFLAKLWTLVEDPETDPLICWSPEGNSFHVFDQGCFAKDVLPKYFKHNNMASFVRQLNMYGFRKVVHIEQGGLVKPEKDDTEFQHPYFIRGQEHLLENIKRKVNNLSGTKTVEVKVHQDNVSKLLTDVQVMKGKQESIDCRLLAMKHENEALWREVASLRQKHAQQQKVVNKLIQFLISLVQSNRILGVKRKIPLMLNDSSPTHSLPKYSRPYSLEPVHGAAAYPASFSGYTTTGRYSPDSPDGPIISDVTEVSGSSPPGSPNPSLAERCSPVILIKDEPLTPDSQVTSEPSPRPSEDRENSLSPTTFIDSILQENDPSEGRSAPGEQEPCLSVACLDSVSSSRPMSEGSRLCSSSSLQSRTELGGELNDHVDVIDTNLDSLQSMFSMDSSTFLDLFSPSLPFSDLDSSLASIQELLSSQDQKSSEAEGGGAGKQLVQYTPQPLILMNSPSSDLPIVLELAQDGPGDHPEDPSLALLTWDCPNTSGESGIS
ncbi:heat shock factor protein 1 isoform X1 [Bufo bufo]|uniref:heat shock factor protein 1 isoform X1 n=1 Tax=Bufo bufo TaxID=8384 RepID=UPI001ABDE79A|nr:heat shock factor protein 1 isoform X1 [Bufo bufo]